MSEVYQILFSSPSASGFHPNGLTGGDGAWKSLSNPSVVIVTLNKPQTIHHISLENAGAATVEVSGLPQTSPIQGVNAKENTYLIILEGKTLASPAEWKAQTGVDRHFEFTEFDDDSAGVVFSQLKFTLRGYGSGKAIGMKNLKLNSKPAVVKQQSVALPSLALELDSDDEDTNDLPSLKSESSGLLQGRLKDLKEKLQKQEEDAKMKTSEAPPVPLAPSVSYVVKVANEAEFDPNYKATSMDIDEPAKPIIRPKKEKSTAAAPFPPSEKPLSHIILSVSGIGPERAEIRTIVTELGGTYDQNLPNSVAPGKQVILLVDASSDQWENTPKHQQAVAKNYPIVDRSWLTACQKKSQFLAIAPYLPQFRSAAPKAKPAALAVPAPAAKPKKSTIKSEGGSFATDKKAKGDEVESDGPDEYVFDDFVVPDDDEIEYFDDPLDYVDEENLGGHFSAHHGGGSHSQHHKKAAPTVNKVNVPARNAWTAEEVQNRWELWLVKCQTILGGKAVSIGNAPNLAAFPKQSHAPSAPVTEVETKFGMDIDDAASDGTNPIDADEYSELNRE